MTAQRYHIRGGTANDISHFEAEGEIQEGRHALDFALQTLARILFLIQELVDKLRIGIVDRILSAPGSNQEEQSCSEEQRGESRGGLIQYGPGVHRSASLPRTVPAAKVQMQREVARNRLNHISA